MAVDQKPIRMTLAERDRAIKLLDEILERTGTVRFELYAVARRQDRIPSAFSDEMLDAIADAARRLISAADRVPVDGG